MWMDDGQMIEDGWQVITIAHPEIDIPKLELDQVGVSKHGYIN